MANHMRSLGKQTIIHRHRNNGVITHAELEERTVYIRAADGMAMCNPWFGTGRKIEMYITPDGLVFETRSTEIRRSSLEEILGRAHADKK